jgi:hypothetical protein
MAVDTASKRYAMLGLCAPHRFVAPVPDGTIAQADRQQFLYGYPGILWGAAAVSATLAGGVFRRLGDLSRVFRRLGDLARVFTGFLPRMGQSILYDTRVKDASEVILYVFDFSRFPELVAGETLSSPSIPAVSGLTIGTPTVTVADQVVFSNGQVVEAGQGVQVTVSGGTAATTYSLECHCTTSGGATRVIKGSIVVE